MSTPTNKFAIRRILVALDASPHSLAALDMAADLAARMQAELAGLFVEDVELLRSAESPSAKFVSPAATSARLNRSAMERNLKAQSEQIRQAVAEAAHRTQVRWSFQTVRGEVTSSLRAAAGEHDIVAVGRRGWAVGQRLRIGSTALSLAASSIPLLFISQPTAVGKLRPLVYYDGSAESQNALLVAARVAAGEAKAITVLLSTGDFEIRRAEIQNLLRDQPIETRYRKIDLQHHQTLLRAAREEGAVLLVLASRQLLKPSDGWKELLRDLEAPLLVLGDGISRQAAAEAH